MATYAIGDVQGCCDTLERLLKKIDFSTARDRLWMVGDLVNRGPRNVEVLRLMRSLGECVVAVLGNHDLHLIARAHGLAKRKKRDTVEDVLEASDRDELVAWLRAQPLVHREGRLLLVHAGLSPFWTVGEAEELARKIERGLDGSHLERLLDGEGRLGEALRVMTRIRTCHTDGELCDFDGHPDDAPSGCVPWFEHPERLSRKTTVVFGHWSALGLHLGENSIGLDTGCVWGRTLTAVRLEDREVFSQRAVERR